MSEREMVANAPSPGKLKLEEWEAATRVTQQKSREYHEAQIKADELYREMVRLGREEGWHV